MSGPFPEYFAPLTVPASWAYGIAVARRNARFDRGRGVQTVDRPVISVGNITTGGTGKTPMVMWIVEQLLQAGHQPIISMRGYGARDDELSDEEAQYIERLPGVPILAYPDRAAALNAFLPEHPQVDCVVLDDGFQHRQLKRDLDLVLIDASADTLRDRLLPAGNLREPLGNLRRADAVIVTRAESHDNDLSNQIEQLHGRAPLAWSRHIWTQLHVFDKSIEPLMAAATFLRDKRVLTMLGVGNPRSILKQLEVHGSTVVAGIPAADHERYDRAKVAVACGLVEGCDAMVVTAKDWVKLRNLIDFSAWPKPIIVPQMAIQMFEGERQLLQRLLGVMGTATADESAR